MVKENRSADISVASTAALFIATVTLLVLLGGLAWWYWGEDLSTEWAVLRQLMMVCFIIWGATLSALILGFIAFRLLIRDKVLREQSLPTGVKRKAPSLPLAVEISKHLRKHYSLFWRRKVHLLLVVGEESALTRQLPGLKEQRWLEANRTVLIYGGSLSAPLDEPAFAALRTLRRGRPLDGIILLINPQHLPGDNDLCSLENIGDVLHYQPPVWLWQLCHSEWEQPGRITQPVGVLLAGNARPEDVAGALNQLLPQLREQGLAQVAQQGQNDFLLRLAQRLEQGESLHWQQRLTPWLAGTRRRALLRGLMFSLPDTQVEPTGGVSAAPAHALKLPVALQGVVDDCLHVRGRRIGMAWEQTLAWTLMTVLGVWGAGLLLSFAVNRQQIISVAEKSHALVKSTTVSDAQLTALYELRNVAGRLQHRVQVGSPWYQRFGLDHNSPLLTAMLSWYGFANNRLIRDPASAALQQNMTRLVNLPPASPLRSELAKPGYDQLKAWLMMARPDKVNAGFFAQTMAAVQPTRAGISPGLWQSLSPDLWAFYLSVLPSQPAWKISPDAGLVTQSRQVLLEQIGRRNAESTLYGNMLTSVRRHYADLRLDDMTHDTDARRLFRTDEVVPGMFTRQAWEGGIQQAIDNAVASRRDEIDWVLSDSRHSLSADLTPQALKARLTARYFADFAGAWLNFLNSLRWRPVHNIADVTDQLTLMSDVRQSPMIALMSTLAWQGQSGEKVAGLSDALIRSVKDLTGKKAQPVTDPQAAGPLDDTFGPLLALMGKSRTDNVIMADTTLSLQTYLTRITRVRLRLQQIAGASDPQERMQTLAQTVFQGKSVDLADTRQYGSLVAASLGEEWGGFGQTMFVQPLTQAWETVLQPSAASLNDKWNRSVVKSWHNAFDGRYPFAASLSDASLPMLAEFIRQSSGRIERFLSSELSGVLHKEGSQWVPDGAHSQGLTFNPAFLKAVNQLSQLSDILFTDGTQSIRFELQAQPVAQVVETQLMIDGQPLHYFNQMADWQSFRWPGETFKPGTMLTWTSTRAGARLFGDYTGTWGFIRWLEQGKSQYLGDSQWMMNFTAPDASTLQWVLRTQLSNGPLALLALRGFTLPKQIFRVDTAATAQWLDGNNDDAMTWGDE